MPEQIREALQKSHRQIEESRQALQEHDEPRAIAHALIGIAELMMALTADALDDGA